MKYACKFNELDELGIRDSAYGGFGRSALFLLSPLELLVLVLVLVLLLLVLVLLVLMVLLDPYFLLKTNGGCIT